VGKRQRSEVRGRMTDDRGQNSEVGNWKWECGSRGKKRRCEVEKVRSSEG
jgi:hypothetical protein